MSERNIEEELFENLTSKGKADRQKKFETQRRIYELKEMQRLKRESRGLYDYDYWRFDNVLCKLFLTDCRKFILS